MNSPTNLAAFRLSRAAKQALLNGETRKVDTRPAKLAAAIQALGRRYVLHRANRVKRLTDPLPENFRLAARKGRK